MDRILRILSAIKEVVVYLGIPVLIVMAMNINHQAVATGRSTNEIVKKQTQTLSAIEQTARDAKLTAEQQTTIIICMLQVPIADRTTDVQQRCRREALEQTSVSETPSTAGSNGQKAPGAAGTPSQSSSNATPSSTPAQPNNQQPLINVQSKPVCNTLGLAC